MSSKINCNPLVAAALGLIVVSANNIRAGEADETVDNEWFRAWPPARVTYTLPAPVSGDGTASGDLDTIEFNATYIESVAASDKFHWLLGGQWQRVQATVPDGVPVPNTLQSIAGVIGFDWFFHEGWRARLEVLPGIYSDFQEAALEDLNAPFNAEVSYSFSPRLLVGGQINVNARRKSPVLGSVGVRWKFAEDWLLSFWFPRPRIEYFATENVTLFAGGNFAGGTFVVSDDFGQQHGQPDLDGQPVDFQEIRVGGGIRYLIRDKLAVELSGGWTVDRRYDFHNQDLELNSDGAPYVQFGFGLVF